MPEQRLEVHKVVSSDGHSYFYCDKAPGQFQTIRALVVAIGDKLRYLPMYADMVISFTDPRTIVAGRYGTAYRWNKKLSDEEQEQFWEVFCHEISPPRPQVADPEGL